MKRIVLVFALFAFLISINAHPWKPKHYVIIDTDGGFDDMRAITLMLASPEIRVLSITASPGVLSAEDTYAKVNSLLKTFHHEGVLTGINVTKEIEPMNCKPAKEFVWGNEDTSKYLNKSATEVVSYVVTHTSEPITFVCPEYIKK
jgi:inosine-uridine nucleoside N-ribohydrolase